MKGDFTMNESFEAGAVNSELLNAKNKLSSNFFKRGIAIGIISGLFYGLYSAFITLGMSTGVWGEWYGVNSILPAFAITYLLGALGAAINDTISAVWAIIIASIKGKLGDFFRTLNSRPGRMIALAAVAGGPIAATAYVVALQLAGSIVIPITALCPAVGAILGRILYKQKLTARTILGIAICFLASFMIASTGMGGDAPDGLVLGMIVAFVAALGWGIEGCVAGYATSMVDYEVGITIRQITSGLTNLIILVPVFGLLSGGGLGLSFELVSAAVKDGPAMIWFVVSGFLSVYCFNLWYKGNSMCGTALGMACNATYSFFSPLCCWIVLGVIIGQDGWNLAPIAWIAAVVMSFGILVMAVNPMDLFRKKEA
jgi:drug/metabolite transporter (DMT)-like permease